MQDLAQGDWPKFDERGFSDDEVAAGVRDAIEGRGALEKLLIAGSVFPPERTDLVRAAYDALPDRGEGQSGLLEESRVARKQQATELLEHTAKSAKHADQAARHALFADVRHLLLPTEKSKQLVAPYVMASYLSEYLVSHLLLTST